MNSRMETADTVFLLILVPKAFGTPRDPDKNRDKSAKILYLPYVAVYCLIREVILQRHP
jgi:hypothetical protein